MLELFLLVAALLMLLLRATARPAPARKPRVLAAARR